MIIIFDTSALIEFDRGNTELISFLSDLQEREPLRFALASISFAEFYLGLLKGTEKERHKGINFLRKFLLFNTSEKSSIKFAELKYSLEKKASVIGDADFFIAAIAIENSAALITYDSDFERINGLNAIILKK